MKGTKKLSRNFLPCDDKSEDPEPIVFNVPATYNKKVKVHNWQMETLAEPRENTEIFPPKGNLHKSSYRRLGPREDGTGISETRAMLSQIELKDQYKPIYPRRALLNMHSFALTEEEEREEDLRLPDVLLDPEEIRCMDYRTTTEIDYRLPYPMKPKPPPSPPPPEPWLLHRRTVGYGLHDLENRKGFHTFLDDNMELHDRIAELKSKKSKLYETTVKKFMENFGEIPQKNSEKCREVLLCGRTSSAVGLGCENNGDER